MDAPPPSKRLKEMSASPPVPEGSGSGADPAAGTSEEKDAKLHFVAKKSAGGAVPVDVTMDGSATVGDLAAHLAEREGCGASLITLVCRGKVLGDAGAPLAPLVAGPEAGGKGVVVYIARKPAAAAAPAAPAAAGGPGRRVLLLLRHGQCCHEEEHDEMKALTSHGHRQAEESARYVAQLFDAGKVPRQRALLHSTSRRARETAAKLPQHLPGLEVRNADLLRETDPTNNPLRAEEVFQRLFAAPTAGAADTLIVVAHNNIILYLLMRAAGVPIERAAQAWSLFHLRHASVTRVDVAVSGARQIVSIGAAGHIPHAHVTWHNIAGADMAAWKGGGAERRKFSGRMLVLVRQAGPGAERRGAQIGALALHVKGLSEYMVSGHLAVACTAGARETASAIAEQFKCRPRLLPDSTCEQPEATFLQFFGPPVEHGRDTVVLVAEDVPVLYWLLRALHMSPDEARAMISSYCLSHASVTLLQMRTDRSMKVVAVGDTGHLPLDCAGA